MIKSLFRRSRTGRASLAAGTALMAGALLTQGCLQREVKKQNPNTSNVFVEQIANTAIDKIDLLFVIDNSVSMADKQEILALAVPQMVARLVNPLCVDGEGNTSPNAGGCPAGSAPEFAAVDDIHIGVITSSLGGHGSRQCPRFEEGWNNDDRGRLLGTMRAGLPDDSNGSGFLAWTGSETDDAAQLQADFQTHVEAAGEVGCGFEAPLEAWYRFLVDPQPPEAMGLDGNQRAAVADDPESGDPDGVDDVLLAQRAAFLRPDGLVAIVVLTDENDCSAMDGGSYYNNAGFGYLVAEATFEMPIATSACNDNPNGDCCFSCLQESNPPKGCESFATECAGGTKLSAAEDRANARCFQNKRRFGVDLLYPTQRYVDGLSKSSIVDARNGETVDNPLLRSGGQPRDPGLVFFAGIIGVPWQDIATDASLSTPGIMEYRTAQQLTAKDVDVNGTLVSRWEIILGNPGRAASSKVCQDNPNEAGCGEAPVLPLDPFMIESIAERPEGATNPISGDQIVSSASTNPLANAINGHEANHLVVDSNKYADGGLANDDLQYACIFPLATPKPPAECGDTDLSCDCADEPLRSRPLCQPPAGGAASNTQYFGKAYPGTRILQVLRDFGNNSIVGSICPKIPDGDPTDANFGYNPAVQAIVDRLAEKLAGKCLPRELTLNPDGTVPCEVVEAMPGVNDGGSPLICSDLPGRSAVSDLIDPAVRKQLEAAGRCGGNSGISCSDYQICSIDELTEAGARNNCLTNTADATSTQDFPLPGFCYIDPALKNEAGDFIAGGEESEEIVKNCPATERRLLRFVGADTPTPNSVTFVACTADAASSDAPIPEPPEEAPAGTGGDEAM